MNSSAQSANVSGNDNIVVQASGSGVNVAIAGEPYLRLTQYERRTRLAAATIPKLRCSAPTAPTSSRSSAATTRWPICDDGSTIPRPFRSASSSARAGAARRGSRSSLRATFERRLARGLCVTRRRLDRFRGQNGVEQWRWDKPVLIIVDYAASRAEQLREWLRELVDASLEDRPKLRLLLLERQANRAIGWLATIFGLGDNDDSRAAIALLDPKEPVELPALDELEFRRQVFAALLKRASGALEAPAQGADPEFDRLLADRKWAGDPLYLMMAGLAAAKAGVRGALTLRAPTSPCRSRATSSIASDGSARRVESMRRHRFPGAFVRHMAAIATLTQGLTVAEARDARGEGDARRSGRWPRSTRRSRR